MRASIYARVSLDQRGEGRSVGEQVAECRAWADREGWDVVEVIEETGSASRYAQSTRSRRRWDDVTALIASGRIDILLTWEASRATRQLEEYAALRDVCARHAVAWGYSGTVYDLTKRDARFRTGLDALLAEDESARSSERVRRASRARAVAGTPHGKLPYGYRREYDPTTGALLRQIPDETTAPIVREIIRRVADGDTLYSIAADLTDRGVPIPRPARTRHRDTAWLPTTIRRIAASPTYAAKRVHQGQVVGDAAWPALVDDDTHARALAALEAMNERRPRVDRTVKWLLSGIARCGECTGPMVRHINRGTPTYMCKHCMRVSRGQEKVDDVVVARFLELLSRIDTSAPTVAAPELEEAEADAAALHERLGSLIDQAADGSITAATLARVESRLRPQIAEAERRVRQLRRPSALAGLDLTDPAALWASLPLPKRRQLLADAVEVTVQKAGRGHRVFDPALVEVRPRW